MANLILNTSPYLQPLDYSNMSTAEKALVDALITMATEQIERYCRRTFAAADYTDEKHDGNGWRSIFVKNPPLNSLTDVDIVESDFSSDSTTTTYAATKFDTKAATGEIRFKPGSFLSSGRGVFSEGFQNIQITYNGGFASVPQGIQLACAEMVIQMFDPSEATDLIEKEKIGDYFYAKAKNAFQKMLLTKKKILDSYKIRRISQPVHW